MPELVIWLNRCWTWDPCALCGEGVDVRPGPRLFLRESGKPVCLDCAGVHAPELVRLLCVRDQRVERGSC